MNPMGVADPEHAREDHNQDGDGDDSPGNVDGGTSEVFLSTRTDVFLAREVKLGKFFDFDGSFGLGRRARCARSFRGRRFGSAALLGFGSGGLPRLLRFELSLPHFVEIFGDGFFGIEAKVLGVGANESFIEYATGELVEVFFFDGAKHARRDLDDVGDVVEREFFALACLAKFVSEVAHETQRRLVLRS